MVIDYKDKASRFIQYLQELSRIRAPIVREITSYPHVLWFKDVPREPGQCYLRAWGPDEEYGEHIWLEVIKHEEPVLYEVPDLCRVWVNRELLVRTDAPPELFERIPGPPSDAENSTLPAPAKNADEAAITFLYLADHPEVSEAWQSYIDHKWQPWCELHKRWEAVQSVYSDLFAIYQEQQKLGEEYELIVGLGFFTWETPSGKRVRRHLIAAKALMLFDASMGKFTVTAAADGAQLEVELNMLELEEQPFGLKQSVTEGLASAHDDPWDRSTIDPVLTGIANQFAKGEGEYNKTVYDPTERKASPKPIVDFAPALILRKRSAKGLQQVLDDIKRQIENGVVPTSQFMDLCEHEPSEAMPLESTDTPANLTDQTIYFPLEFNDEQLQIIQKTALTDGLLVQGPPGTGKSHTIANLICHSLATGKRVLVTAKTPRALQVLHNKLPDSVKPLCINLLGSGLEEQRSLEASVSGIMIQQDRWNDDRALQEINLLRQNLDQIRSEKAEIEFRVRSIREKETVEHSIIENQYRGSAEKIANRLHKEKQEFSWFTDSIAHDQPLPCCGDEIKKALKELTKAPANIDAQLDYYFPDPAEVFMAAPEFSKLVKKEAVARQRFESCRENCKSKIGKALISCSGEDLQQLINSLNSISHTIAGLKATLFPWVNDAVKSIVQDLTSSWQELMKALEEKLDNLKERARKIDNLNVEVPAEISVQKLLKDAKELKKHFDGGGKAKFLGFRPKVVKQHGYIMDSVTIDATPCATSETLGQLIEYLSVDQATEYCWHLLEGKAERVEGPKFMQIAVIEEHQEALGKALAIDTDLTAIRRTLQTYLENGDNFCRSIDDIRKLNSICTAIVESKNLRETKKHLDDYVDRLQLHVSKPKCHPILSKAVEIVKSRNSQAYTKCLELVEKFKEAYGALIEARKTISPFADIAPVLYDRMCREPGDDILNAQIEKLTEAWAWARANSWFNDFLNTDDLPGLNRRLERINSDIRKRITKLSSLLAWKICNERMEAPHRRHLVGWQQEVQKIGKGTGKHAPKHRRNAKQHLDKCREAIPAWIMPLHRVYETVPSSPGVFDLIIVDEASQCGFDALPLTYLGKKLLVVGDENQISPEAVGVDKNIVDHLMQTFLFDFEHRDSFDADGSLFAHCKRRFSRPIVLREHFRCMPEIIRFSNDLCYHATPLIPLKQYPPERLEPLKMTHVVNGYREGSNSSVINKPEAKAIVDAIVNCCNDDQYDGKTMGAIILQGQFQAALIENQLIKELDAEEIEKRRIICGNPYSFQGDERDVIFLSMVAAPNKRIGTFVGDADKRRFNVAASRAKEQMWLFHTPALSDLSQNCLRRRLLSFFINPSEVSTIPINQELDTLRIKALRSNRQIEKPPEPFESWFELDVALIIAARKYRVIPQYPVLENKRIDIVVEGTQARLAVECDGDYWHGPDQYDADMDRQRVLERCGWQFFRVRGSAFYLNPEAALEQLWEALEDLDIQPISYSPETKNFDEKEAASDNKIINSKDEKDRSSKVIEPKRSHQTEKATGQVSLFDSIDQVQKLNRPQTIQEALSLKPAQIRNYIVDILKDRPNNSCVKNKLGKYLLKHFELRTWGQPREAFYRKVDSSVSFMQRQGQVKVYKTSKNVRVKLL